MKMLIHVSEEWTYFTQLFIYFITVNKYRFCISGKNNQYRSITSGDPPRYQNWPILQKALLNKHEHVMHV